jgi:hypothetical protein
MMKKIISFKMIKIISLILLILILATYYPLIKITVSNQILYTYKDIFSGQEWQMVKGKNKIIEQPINVMDHMSDYDFQQYNKINDGIKKYRRIIAINQKRHEEYHDSTYTGGLTFDDLGINGGNTLSDYEVTKVLHQEAIKEIQGDEDFYQNAQDKLDNLYNQMDELENNLKSEALIYRNTEKQVRIALIFILILIIFSKKLWKLTKKTSVFIMND